MKNQTTEFDITNIKTFEIFDAEGKLVTKTKVYEKAIVKKTEQDSLGKAYLVATDIHGNTRDI